MSLSADGTDGTYNAIAGYDSKESQTDNRFGDQARGSKIGIGPSEHFVEIGDRLLSLRTDAAGQKVTERRHGAKEQSGPGFHDAVRLGDGRQDDVAFRHPVNSGLRCLTISSV